MLRSVGTIAMLLVTFSAFTSYSQTSLFPSETEQEPLSAKLAEPDPTYPTESVDICRTDPFACCITNTDKCPERLGSTSSPSLGDPAQVPSPICLIDPCACNPACSKTEQSIRLFEGARADENQGTSNSILAPAPTGDGLIFGQQNSPTNDGVFLKNSTSSADTEPAGTFSLTRTQLGSSKFGQANHPATCNDPKVRPREVWRELAISMGSLAQCSESAQILLEEREGGDRQTYEKIVAGTVSLKDKRSFLRAFEDYENDCLLPLNRPQSGYLFQRLFGSASLDQLKMNVGNLSIDGTPFFCSASLVKYQHDGKPTLGLATAKHCIGEPTIGAGAGKLLFDTVNPKMSFETMSGMVFDVQIADDITNFVYEEKNDLVVIPFTTGSVNIENFGFEIAAETPKIWDPLYLVGMNPFLRALRNAEDTDQSSLVDYASVSLEPACRVYGINGSEMRNNCQTEWGMSGSPIFVLGKQGIEIAAIHSGAAFDHNMDFCTDPHAGGANWGVLFR